MTEQYKMKLKKIVLLSKNAGVPLRAIKQCGTPRHIILKSLSDIGIQYSISDNRLKIPKIHDSLLMIDDYEDNLLATKYDYTSILNILKSALITSEQFCTYLGCRKKDYKNIITYLSMKYPIYEDDDERVAYLV